MDDKVLQRCDSHNNSNDDDYDDDTTSTCYEASLPATQSRAVASIGEVAPSSDENAIFFLTSISSPPYPSAFQVTATAQPVALTSTASTTATLFKHADARSTSQTTDACELVRARPNNLSERKLGPPPKREKLRPSRSCDSSHSASQQQQRQQRQNSFQQKLQLQRREESSLCREVSENDTTTTIDNDIVANSYNNNNNINIIGNNTDRRAEEKTKEKLSAASAIIDEKKNKDGEPLMPGDMPINYCYIKPAGSHVSARDSRRSNRLSSAILTTSSSFSSAEESLAAFLDPLRIRSGVRGEELWRHRRTEVGSGNKRVERTVRVSFIITLVGLMAGTIITVFGFVRVEGWSEQKQLAFQILGPTCLVSTLAVWTVGALFWYLWRSEWTREKQAMELKSRVHLHAIAMDLLKKSSPILDSPLSSIVGSNLLLQASGADRRLRRKLLAKLRQRENLEFRLGDEFLERWTDERKNGCVENGRSMEWMDG